MATFLYQLGTYLLGVKAPDLEDRIGSIYDSKVTNPDATEASALGILRGILAAAQTNVHPDIIDRAARLLGHVTVDGDPATGAKQDTGNTALASAVTKLTEILTQLQTKPDRRGLAINKPLAASVEPGTTYWSVDTDPHGFSIEVSNGTAWAVI